ncbi:transposable element Tcb2 transposase [Trichonephila clavipes]|nr:transposable element Tcb2 transposase [Trichonephila clavipes]
MESDSGRLLIWREQRTRYHQSNTVERHSYRGGGILVWAGISLGGHTDLHVFHGGTVTGLRYRDEILDPYVRPYAALLWIDFDAGGSTFHSVRTRRCTRVTDLNSVNQRAHFSFAVASTSLLMKSVQQVYRLRLPNNAARAADRTRPKKNLGGVSNPLMDSLLHSDG